MSEQELHLDEDLAGDKEECDINILLEDSTDRETNEHFQFEEETLQITDIHDFEQSVQQFDFPADETTDLSTTRELQTSHNSPASVIKFHENIPKNDTFNTEAIDLQSEFAALGLNSLYPSVGNDANSSFEVSFDKSTAHENQNDINKISGDKSCLINFVNNTDENVLASLQDVPIDTQSTYEYESFDDIELACKSTNNITQNNDYDLMLSESYPNTSDYIPDQSDNSNLEKKQSSKTSSMSEGQEIYCNENKYSEENVDIVRGVEENPQQAQITHLDLVTQDNVKEIKPVMTDEPQDLLITVPFNNVEVQDCLNEIETPKFEPEKCVFDLNLPTHLEKEKLMDHSSEICKNESFGEIEKSHTMVSQGYVKENCSSNKLTFEGEIQLKSNKNHQMQQSGFEAAVEKAHTTEYATSNFDITKDSSSVQQSTMDVVINEPLFKDDIVRPIHKLQNDSCDEPAENTSINKEHPSQKNSAKDYCQEDLSINKDTEEEIRQMIKQQSECKIFKEDDTSFSKCDDITDSHQLQQSVCELKNDKLENYCLDVIGEDTLDSRELLFENHLTKEILHVDKLSEVFEEEKLITEGSLSNIDIFKNPQNIQQPICEGEVIGKHLIEDYTSDAMEEPQPTNDHIKDTQQEPLLPSCMDVKKDAHSLEQSILEHDIINNKSYSDCFEGDMHAMEETTPKDNSLIQFQVPQSVIELVKNEKDAIKETVTEYDIMKEICDEPNLGNPIGEIFESEECSSMNFAVEDSNTSDYTVRKDPYSVKDIVLDSDSIYDTHQVQQHSYDEILKEETLVSEEIMITNEVAQDTTLELLFMDKEGSTEEHLSKNEIVKEESNAVDKSFPENCVINTNLEDHFSCEVVVEDTPSIKESPTKHDAIRENNQVPDSSYKVTKQPLPLPNDDFSNDTYHLQHFGVVGETDSINEFVDKSDVDNVTHQVQQTSVVVLEYPMVKNDNADVTNQVEISASGEVIDETHVDVDTSKSAVMTDKIPQITQTATETLVPIVELNLSKNVDTQNDVQYPQIEPALLNSIEESNIIEGHKSTDLFNCTHDTVPDTLSEANNYEAISSTHEEQNKVDAACSFDTSNQSCQTLDMSLTTLCAPSNTVDRSDLCRGSDDTPLYSLSQTLTDFLDNYDTKETNNFTDLCDHKPHDALYVPLIRNNTTDCSLNENAMQSFMEITMANTDEARIDQSFSNIKKQEESNNDKIEYKSKESPEDIKQNESPCLIGSLEDEVVPSSKYYVSEFQCDSEQTDSKNHEMMQQSMSNYVTNLSLKLTIPDSCDLSHINIADEDIQKQCEIQTENVLLMKWPAQYHNDIKMLKQENLHLLESCNQKDAYINQIKNDHEILLRHFSKLSQTKDLNQENCEFEVLSSKLTKDSDLIVQLKQENRLLKTDLDFFKGIEKEFLNFKKEHKEFVSGSVNERLANENDIANLKTQIKELENELLNMGQTVTDLRSKNKELSEFMENIQSKDRQIQELTNDKLLLEEKVASLGMSLERFDGLKEENDYLSNILKLEKVKNNEMVKLQMMLEEQNNKISDQQEKLTNVSIDLNMKEHQIQDLIESKVNLEETIASLNQLLEKFQSVEDENNGLKSLFQETKNNRDELLMHNKSLEELISLHNENISKLSHDINEKDCQIEAFMNINADLKGSIESLELRLKDVQSFEIEIENLKMNVTVKDEKLKEMFNVKTSLEDQIQSLKAQNDLLWNELKVTSTKEQSLYSLKEEKLKLEEKLSLMKREIQDIETLKSDNEQLVDELTDKIRSLTADKKKLKVSLIKVNDKLNEGDAEINKLHEEKVQLQNNFEETTKQFEDLKEELNFERVNVAESIGSVSEYCSSVFLENVYLAQEIFVAETQGKKLNCELGSIKEEIIEKRCLFDKIQSEKENLEISVSNLKETIGGLTAELNQWKQQCNELTILKDEQVELKLTIRELNESVDAYEEEKTCMLENMSSLSESISNLLIDRQLLLDQDNHCSDLTKRLAVLTAENHQLEQNNSELLQSMSIIQNQLHIVNDQERTIDELRDFSESLENHLSSLNEELMSEVSKNQFLSVAISEIESKLSKSNEELLSSQSTASLMMEQLNTSRDRGNELQELITGLEDHMSSLNEELMSEIAKNHFLSMENENLLRYYNQAIEENLLLQKTISLATVTLKDRFQNISVIDKTQWSLQTCIDEILLQISGLELENVKLNQDINSFTATLESSKKNLSDLSEVEQNMKLELNSVLEQKLDLENKLTIALANEPYIVKLEKEIEILLNLAETHKGCEHAKQLFHDEKSKLELEVQTLTDIVEELRNSQNQFDKKLKDSLHLRDIMSKEIHSLTGEIWDSDSEPLIEVYQKLMKEFLNKEKEVIFSLQKDFEHKLEHLKNQINEREVLSSKLENDLEDYKTNLNHRDVCISNLESELFTLKNQMGGLSHEIEEIKSQAEKEKETLTDELNSALHVKTQLEENILILNDDVSCKLNEILQLKNDLEKKECETSNLLKRSEEDFGITNQQKNLLDELTLSLNDKLKLISELNIQLNEKTNELSQLTECLRNKDSEITQYISTINETTQSITKLSTIESDLNTIMNVTSIGEKFDLNYMIGSLQSCQLSSDTVKLVVSKFVNILKESQIHDENLGMKLFNQIEKTKSLETHISEMNEELKSCKILYDEDSLQFKEEIAAKSDTIAHLTEALEQFKSYAHLDSGSKTKCTEIEDMKDQIEKLKEENIKLQSETTKISYLTEVNRKLSWEIEELSRCIKLEKQNNTELKVKCELVNNQVADLSKKNFQLEDLIDVLERKLENHDVISSLKIDFPFGVNTVDKQVQYLNEKLSENNQIVTKLNMLTDDYCSLKHEYEKSKEYIKKQEEKICKIMKRELELKKQLASNSQTISDIQIFKEVKSELLTLFPDPSLSISDVLLKIKSLVGDEKKDSIVKNPSIEDLERKIEEISQENRDLDTECEMMNKHIEEQKELLASVFKREEELKRLNTELELKLSNHLETNDSNSVGCDLKELFEIFPETPISLHDSVNLVKSIIAENQSLKEKIAESQEEYASLDKECEDMFKAYKEKEKDLADVLKREASSVSDLKNKQKELEIELKSLSEELQVTRSQLTLQESRVSVPGLCQCDELKSRLSELRMDLAERNAKITALELQFEADNFPLKKKVADLEKSLDQAKHKINELKSEVRRYQEQMCDVTVGLRAECERCRSFSSSVDPATATSLQLQLQEKNKEIHILKALCKTRNQRIKELEDRDGSSKVPRSHRSALKEVKENKTVPSSPTKPVKGSFS